jgi:hypothetical protein
MERFGFLPIESRCLTSWVNPSSKECLGSVDVTKTGQSTLIHQERFNWQTGTDQKLGQTLGGEVPLQGLDTETGELLFDRFV